MGLPPEVYPLEAIYAASVAFEPQALLVSMSQVSEKETGLTEDGLVGEASFDPCPMSNFQRLSIPERQERDWNLEIHHLGSDLRLGR
jgi:hypothetical protein